MKKIIITYGIISGVIGIISSYLTLNNIVGTWTLLGLGILISFLIYFLGIKNFKSTNNGFASFRTVFLICFGISALGTVISFIGTQLYIQTLSEEQKSEITTKIIDSQIAVYENFGLEIPEEAEEEMEAAGETMFDFKTLLINSIAGLFISAFIAVIFALIFKKDPPTAAV